MAEPQDIRQCNSVAQGYPLNMSLSAFLLDQYSMARDVSKLSQTFSCNLEGNVRDGVQEKQMFKNVRENGDCIYFVRLLRQQLFRGKFLLHQLCIRENKVQQIIQSLY